MRSVSGVGSGGEENIKTHQLIIREIDRNIFEAIKDGTKTIETRAATDKYRAIKEGDILDFVCSEEHLQKKVIEVRLFRTIEEMVEKFGIKPIVPFADSIEEMKNIYYSFPNYREKIANFGLIAFKLE